MTRLILRYLTCLYFILAFSLTFIAPFSIQDNRAISSSKRNDKMLAFRPTTELYLDVVSLDETIEQRHEKSCVFFFACAKTKTQISCAIISALDSYIESSISLLRTRGFNI